MRRAFSFGVRPQICAAVKIAFLTFELQSLGSRDVWSTCAERVASHIHGFPFPKKHEETRDD